MPNDALLYTKVVEFCIFSGDPGCLGWPDWHEQDCVYEEVECLFCKCGGHNVYGEMYHEPDCPLFMPEPPFCLTTVAADREKRGG